MRALFSWARLLMLVVVRCMAIDNPDDAAFDKKTMEVLVPVDHSKISYEPFRKSFYSVHPAIASMSRADVDILRKELVVRTQGADVPNPIQSFVQLGFDRKMLALLMKLGLEAPTAIQAQAFPIALSGRDMIGIAKTGSGKTLAFTLPMVRHVMDQRELQKGEGPIAVVLSPTRELAHQIYVNVKKFTSIYGANCAAVYGGVGKWEQTQALRKGAEVVVATPGRLIEMIRKKTAKMNRVTFVVLDEADRMFEMGFEPQLRSIMGQIRPDRQTLMFSATFRRRIEALALDVLNDPVKITIGQIGQANEDIQQIAVVLQNDRAKWPWLMANLKAIADEGRVLIFASSKAGCEELAKNLNAMNFRSYCLHGDKTQQERSEALNKFKAGECRILVATDVASRGLDVKDVKNVVNFDVAKSIDTHVHRIGRTGRMGLDGFESGTAYTLVTMKEGQFAAQLVHNMNVSGQSAPPELLTLAGMPQRGTQQRESNSKGRDLDQEDTEEMERWTAIRPKSKAEQRKGLGFGGPAPSGTFGRNFVKASATNAGSVPSSFRMAFVKASAPPSSNSATPAKVPIAPVQPLVHLPPQPRSLVPPPPPPIQLGRQPPSLVPSPPPTVLIVQTPSFSSVQTPVNGSNQAPTENSGLIAPTVIQNQVLNSAPRQVGQKGTQDEPQTGRQSRSPHRRSSSHHSRHGRRSPSSSRSRSRSRGFRRRESRRRSRSPSRSWERSRRRDRSPSRSRSCGRRRDRYRR